MLALVVITAALAVTVVPDTSRNCCKTTSTESSAPLLLSPYIRAGKLGLGRSLSRVGPLPRMSVDVAPRTSYSGFITVDKHERASHLFFWFFPALNEPESAPVLLWLDGGPGFTNLVSVLHQNGPYSYVQAVLAPGSGVPRIEARPSDSDWTQDYSMIYVDNPVGTGFSHGGVYPTSCEENAEHLLSFLRQFRTLYPDYATEATPLYLVGESFGAHIAPVLATLLLRKAPVIAKELSGVLLLVPWINPSIQASFNADYMYQLGLIDQTMHSVIEHEQNRALALANAGHYAEARNVWFGLVAGPSSAFAISSGFMCAYNSMKAGIDPVVQSGFGPEFEAYLNSTEFRTAVHAGAQTPFLTINATLMEAMAGEAMKSKAGHLPKILDADGGRVQVTLVSGQLDTTVIHLGVEAVLDALNWTGKAEWTESKRRMWKLNPFDGVPAGYIRSARNLNYFMLRNAGHLLIADAPELSLWLVKQFIPR